MTNSIVNHSYEDTRDGSNIPSVLDKMRSGSESFDSGIPKTNTDYSNDEPQADDQYNVIQNNIDEEYNKISFQQTPIPFDQNYGHINSTNPIQNKEYDHVDGVQELNLQTYSHVNQQVLTDEAESKGQSTNTQSNRDTKHIADSTYDHLTMSVDKDPQDFDELQDEDYSHLSSSGANTAHTKPRRGNRDRNVVKPYGLSNTAKQTEVSKDTEHAYFVLESDNNAAMPQTESNTTDTAVHPYFILEPSAKLPYTQIERNMGETAEHSYFTLEPDSHSKKH